MSDKPHSSPIGIVSYPTLFTPRAISEDAKEKYSLVLILDEAAQNTPEFKRMKKAVVEAARTRFGEKADQMIKSGQIKLPFRDNSARAGQAGYEEGGVFINASTERKPDVIDGRLNKVVESDVYPGALARITYNTYTYDMNGNKGVGIGLIHVQFADFTTPRIDGGRTGAESFDALDSTDYDSDVDDDELDDLFA